jgi:hypothetical protein
MFQDLKFDQNFINNTGLFVVQDATNKNTSNFFAEESSEHSQSSAEESKPSDQFTTPSESPHNESIQDDRMFQIYNLIYSFSR